MLDKTTVCEYNADLFHCDFSKHLFLGHLGTHLLNVADKHSGDRGYGVIYLQTIDATWVLSRLAIEMERMPEANEHFTVETWVESVMKYFTSRDFEIKSKDGTVLGYSRSMWAMINTRTREPMDIFSVRDGIIRDYVEKEKPCPIARPSRVTMSDSAEKVGEEIAKYCDIDVNGHINSIEYIRHVLDLFSMSWYAAHRLQRFDIAYVAEGHCGDTLQFFREEVSPLEYNVEIKKVSDDCTEPVVLCRSKVKFVNI